MLIVKLLVNEKLLEAEVALNQADSGNIIELGLAYLKILNEYREELYKLRGVPEINLKQPSPLARELTEQVRKAIRSAVEITTRERNQTELLIESFTSLSGYEAIDTFNRLKFKGVDNWELGANSIHSKNSTGNEKLTIQEAVDAASLLRREAYIIHRTIFLK
jgi:hypothetical protein